MIIVQLNYFGATEQITVGTILNHHRNGVLPTIVISETVQTICEQIRMEEAPYGGLKPSRTSPTAVPILIIKSGDFLDYYELLGKAAIIVRALYR